MFAAIPTLQTERLLLRSWRQSDLAPFAALNADPEVMEFMSRGPLTREASDAWVGRINDAWTANGYGLWAVEVIDGPEFIGFVGLADALFEAPFTPAIEVGWRLARSSWGHGYATEGARAALCYGFRGAGLAEILTFTAAANSRSKAVMERLGMVRDSGGDFDYPGLPSSHRLRPHVLYRLSDEALRQLRYG